MQKLLNTELYVTFRCIHVSPWSPQPKETYLTIILLSYILVLSEDADSSIIINLGGFSL